jgi:hypothetical protein
MHCNGCSGLAVPAQKAITQPTGMLQPDFYYLLYFVCSGSRRFYFIGRFWKGNDTSFFPAIAVQRSSITSLILQQDKEPCISHCRCSIKAVS